MTAKEGDFQGLKEAIVDLYLAIKIRSADEVFTSYLFDLIVRESG